MKQCIICSADLNGENTTWYRQKNYIHKCNHCIKIEKKNQARESRAGNPSLARSRSAKCRMKSKENNPVRYTSHQMAGSSAKRAKALGMEYNLNTDFISSICPVLCPVFGFELKYGGGEKTKKSASLDRIDSSKGYTVDNVMVISSLANTMKSNATTEELIIFGRWAQTHTQTDSLRG